MLQAGKSRVGILIRSMFFVNFPNLSNRTIALGLTQRLTEIGNRYISGGEIVPDVQG
jgi:hypothetical protein